MRLKKSLKWADSRPGYLWLLNNLLVSVNVLHNAGHRLYVATLGCAVLLSLAGNPAAAQPFLFEKIEAPFDVFDAQGEQLQLPFLGGFNVPRPQFVDIDGDGDQDLFVQEKSNQLIFFEHLPGEAEFPFIKQTDVFQELSIGEWFRFVDLDQDGDQDLLAESPFSFIRVYENTGGASTPLFTAVQDSLRDESGAPIFADRQNILNVVDIDGDQLLDLFIGRLDGTMFHYEQVISGAAVQDLTFSLQSEQFQNIIVTGPQGKEAGRHGANTLLFYDIEQDGDYDLFWGDFFEAGLLFFENVGTPQIPQFQTELIQFPVNDPVLTSGYNAPAFGDVDGDGLADLLVGVLGGAFSAFGAASHNLLYFKQEPGNQFSFVRSQFFYNIDVGSDGYPVLFDVDSDGDNDLLLGNSIDPGDTNTGSLRLYENTGDANQPVFQDRGNLPVEPAFGITPALGDLNGDGAVDMISGSFRGEMTLYLNDNAGNSFTFSDPIPAYLDIPTSSSSTPFLADMDADDDLDLLVGQSSGVINYFENTGTTQEPQFTLITSSYGDIDVGRRSVPVVADIDGDNDFDLMIGSDQDGIQTFENTGTPQHAEFVQVEWFDLAVERRMAPAWGDLNGDVNPELMIGLLDGGVQYYENRTIRLSSGSEGPNPKIDAVFYPNPSREISQLRITGVRNQHVTVDLYSILGQYLGAVYEGFVYDEAIEVRVDLSAYAPGAYLVRVLVDGARLEKIVFKSN